MGGHKRHGQWPRTGHGRPRYSSTNFSSHPSEGYPDPRIPRSIPRIVVIIALAVWSLLALIGYVSVNAIIGWAASLADIALASGEDLATTVGLGKEAGSVAGSLKATGLLDQTFALLQWIAKPAIVVVWAIGALVIAIAPSILSRMRGLLGRR